MLSCQELQENQEASSSRVNLSENQDNSPSMFSLTPISSEAMQTYEEPNDVKTEDEVTDFIEGTKEQTPECDGAHRIF